MSDDEQLQERVMRAYDRSGNPHFRIGDIVTRDGSDRQRVIETDGTDDYAPTTITVVCIREPATDELSPGPWIRLGEREFNLARRYSFAGRLKLAYDRDNREGA